MAGAPGALGAAEPAKPKSDKIPFYKKEFHIGKAVKGEELMNFSRQTASFLRAGIPVLDALAVLVEDNDNKAMVRVLSDIRTTLQQGGGLGDSIVVASEGVSQLLRGDGSIGRADRPPRRHHGPARRLSRTRSRGEAQDQRSVDVSMRRVRHGDGCGSCSDDVRAASVQGFVQVDVKADLPLTTRALLGSTDFVTTWWWAILLGFAGVGGIAYALIGGSHGKPRRDRLLLKLPGAGPLLHYVIVERFCRVLAAMVQAGVPLPDALCGGERQHE